MAENQTSIGQDIGSAAQKGGEAVRAAKTMTKAAAAAGSGNWVGAAVEVAKNPKAVFYTTMAIVIPILFIIICTLSLPSMLFTKDVKDVNDDSFNFTTEEGLLKTHEKISKAIDPLYEAGYQTAKQLAQADAAIKCKEGGYYGLMPVQFTGAYVDGALSIDYESLMAIVSVQSESEFEQKIKEAEEDGTDIDFDYEPPTVKEGIKIIKTELTKHQKELFFYTLIKTEPYYTNIGTTEEPEYVTLVRYTYQIDQTPPDLLAENFFGLVETEEDPQLTKYRHKSENLKYMMYGDAADVVFGSVIVSQTTKAIVTQYFNEGTETFTFDGQYKYPFDQKYRMSSPFSQRTNPVTGKREFHQGIDLAAPGGASIKSISDGVVISAGFNSSYGNRVLVYHGHINDKPVLSLSAHMSKITATKGTKVKAGDELGKVGSTGRSTGNHLHIEIIMGSEYLNPADYLQGI